MQLTSILRLSLSVCEKILLEHEPSEPSIAFHQRKITAPISSFENLLIKNWFGSSEHSCFELWGFGPNARHEQFFSLYSLVIGFNATLNLIHIPIPCSINCESNSTWIWTMLDIEAPIYNHLMALSGKKPGSFYRRVWISHAGNGTAYLLTNY